MRRVGLQASSVCLALLGAALFSGRAGAGTPPNIFDLSNDWGDIGLMQTPTARMADDGEIGGGVQEVYPYAQLHLSLQALPWLETAVRYTEVLDVPFGAGSRTNSPQHYKDRSVDFKVHLVEEGRFLPAVAMGIQDFGGTGLFSSQYLVASRRFYDFDFSLGLAWGRAGTKGGLYNPFRLLSNSHFGRPYTPAVPGGSGVPGSVTVSDLFIGKDVGFIGGVRWKTPVRNVFLDVEFDGNNYHEEAFAQKFNDSFPLNVGVKYCPFPELQFGVGYERGNKVTASVMLRTNFEKNLGTAKLLDPPPPQIYRRPEELPLPVGVEPPAQSTTLRDIRTPTLTGVMDDDTVIANLKQMLAEQNLKLVAVTLHGEVGNAVVLWLEQDNYRYPARIVGRAARVLSEFAPKDAEYFTIIEVRNGMEMFRVTIERHDLERAAVGESSPEEILVDANLGGGQGDIKGAEYKHLQRFPNVGYDIAPQLRQNVGSPAGFYFYQFWMAFNGVLHLTPHWDMQSTIGVNLYNDFSGLPATSDSVLPHVRSDIDLYLQKGANNLVNLETNYIWSPAPQLYGRFSGGVFEEMYGGVATELLYRPFAQRWAVGVNVNHVWQRTYTQRLSFMGYQVTTAFVDLYYEWPYHNVLTQITVGRYLAGDLGGTVSIARRFRDGVVAGAFATKTNVSAARFGEGSFDKGIFISIPLDLGLPFSTRRYASTLFRPLTRDGGQRAEDGTSLYPLTDGTGLGTVYEGWPDLLR